MNATTSKHVMQMTTEELEAEAQRLCDAYNALGVEIHSEGDAADRLVSQWSYVTTEIRHRKEARL